MPFYGYNLKSIKDIFGGLNHSQRATPQVVPLTSSYTIITISIEVILRTYFLRNIGIKHYFMKLRIHNPYKIRHTNVTS